MTFTTDLNAAPNSGITAQDRRDGVNAAANAALAASDNSFNVTRDGVDLRPQPGPFQPLTEDEIMAGRCAVCQGRQAEGMDGIIRGL